MAFFSGLKAYVPMILVLYFSLASFPKPGLADLPYFLCSNVTYNLSTNSQFKKNLNTLFTDLSSKAYLSVQFNTSIGDGPDRAYGQFMCVPFLSGLDCGDCITNAYQAFRRNCPDDWEAIVWVDNCQLRYSNRNFLGYLDVSGNRPYANSKNISNPGLFTSVVRRTVGDLTKLVASNGFMKMYAKQKKFEGSETLYALVQCTSDLSSHQCVTCLNVALENITSWYYFSRGARLLSRSCYVRYELYAFYQGATGESPAQEHNNKIEKWLIIAIVAVAVSAFFGVIVFCLVSKRGDQRTWNKINNQGGQFQNSGNQSYIEFHQRRDGLSTRHSPFVDLASIRRATKNFSESNLLGQGGFGSVYKGVLFDGKEVAIKRLSIDSEQGTEEFSNEVLLIMKLQHKNLVRLLGFCVHGEEKLLVYEFMPNSSLDRMLFDPKYQKQLDWNKRVNIINGIARGLLYLHQDSRLRIIHRDLKASNVLLDSDMEPKISDFGTARIYAGNEGEITGRPVGTCGYMAPEYAMEGLYSTKSDVYSFGVLMLVIITGRMGSGLVANAWRLWSEDNALEFLDPSLTDPQHSDEFLRLMHIGLLCVQHDAGDRPTVPSVVSMLTSESADLAQPEKPAFAAERSTDHKEDCKTEMSANGVTVSSISPR